MNLSNKIFDIGLPTSSLTLSLTSNLTLFADTTKNWTCPKCGAQGFGAIHLCTKK